MGELKLEHKMCRRCNEWLPANKEYFYSNPKNKTDGWHSYCKVCIKNDSTKWKKDNRDRWLEIEKKQNNKPNKKLRLAENSQKQRENGYFKQWQEQNPEKLKLYQNMHQDHKISNEEWIVCKEYFDNSCAYCGLHISEHFITYAGELKHTDFHKEHVDDNGANDLSNCVPSCKSCNSSKHIHELSEWYNEENLNYSKERFERIVKWLSEDYNLCFENS